MGLGGGHAISAPSAMPRYMRRYAWLVWNRDLGLDRPLQPQFLIGRLQAGCRHAAEDPPKGGQGAPPAMVSARCLWVSDGRWR